MSVFAIADLHLSLAPDIDKPMDIYGYRWHDHVARLEKNWRELVKDDDTVIIAGDISWALKLENAKYDLDWVDSLPGQKVMYKGNHDLWWNGITKLNKMYDSITFVQNDCFAAEDFVCRETESAPFFLHIRTNARKYRYMTVKKYPCLSPNKYLCSYL